MGSLGGIRLRDEGTGDDDAFETSREREKSRFVLMNC